MVGDLSGRLLAAAIAGGSTVLTSGAVAQPTVLTLDELDQVTAAGVGVDVDVIAQAIGQATGTYTDTLTNVFNSPWLSLSFGVGIGEAVACCGPDAEVAVDTSVVGNGQSSAGDTFDRTHNNGVYAIGITTGWVLTIVTPSPDQVTAYGQQLKDQVSAMLPIAAFQGVGVQEP